MMLSGRRVALLVLDGKTTGSRASSSSSTILAFAFYYISPAGDDQPRPGIALRCRPFSACYTSQDAQGRAGWGPLLPPTGRPTPKCARRATSWRSGRALYKSRAIARETGMKVT